MKFIGRTEELSLLNRSYAAKEAAFIPIYGRRRVGKSELILKFIKKKPALYFLGKQALPELQIREFLENAARVVEEPLLATYPAQDWREVLTALTERWSERRKLILVFDEFQWTVAASPELPSLLQECWDRYWRPSANVMLILCGSYVGFMEREVLGQKSPLFGRRNGQILLRPFDYHSAAEFHPNYSHVDCAKTYFLCGGVPLYLQFFDEKSSVDTNIIEKIVDPFSAMHREPEFLLREELRDVDRYYAVLLAVAAGHTSHQSIATASGVAVRSLHYYLQNLMELGYIARRYPLTGERPSPRHVRYVIDDPLLRFWFRFVYPHQSLIANIGAVRVFKELIEPELDAYYGFSFERLCREALPRLYAQERVRAAYEIGEYWDKSVQIDLVGWRHDGWTDLGECKWGRVRSPKKIEQELAQKVIAYPNRRNATIGQRIFTHTLPSSVATRQDSIRWHSLKELYA